jgi:hypothetical protein
MTALLALSFHVVDDRFDRPLRIAFQAIVNEQEDEYPLGDLPGTS